MRLIEPDHPGCWNRGPFKATYLARMSLQNIKHVMSQNCRSDFDINREKRCKGCLVEQDIEYFKERGLIK